MSKPEGISFIVRVRNEEATLEASLRSLLAVTVPKEILVFLHLCTDRSTEIATRLAAEHSCIRVFPYEVEISRAGYETLATDMKSPHSLMTYYNWCFSKATKMWKCKWDADFTMTPELLDYVNRGDWSKHSKVLRLGSKNSTSVESNDYFFSCEVTYIKHLFWEVPYFWYYPDQYEKKEVADVFIAHNSELSEVKSYWKAEPWYRVEDSDEARLVASRMDRLVAEFGPEPIGLARSMHPDCERLAYAIGSAKPSYINFYT
jgi:glycosyltransferase involved in cell wall biosynthesis